MEAVINVNTKLIALLGTPLGQSFAAKMQNAGYTALGLNYLYFPVEVDNAGLGKVVDAIRVMNFAGFAVTKPNKVEITKYLDEIDDIAKMMGSCNTVVKLPDGRLKGYNTDGYGALRSIKEAMGDLTGLTCFCFGAGGTGRSVCLELAKAGVKKIYLCSRSAACEELAAHINQFFPGLCEAVRADQQATIAEALKGCELVLNLSGSGMAGQEDKTPVDKNLLHAGQVCFDATYNPEKTRFLKEAEEMGCKIINGLDMSLYQGVRQVSLWTGVAEDEAIPSMRAKLVEIVYGK